MQFALNHMTAPGLSFADFLDLAASLGCVGVEARNDLKGPLFDGMDAASAGRMTRDKGLRLVGLSEVYPFNHWTAEREAAVRALIDTAKAAGAETINLIPRNDGIGIADGERQANLRTALTAILPMLRDADLIACVEPLGFERCSLRFKAEAVEMIEAVGGASHFKLVHDTFHHAVAGGGPVFADQTGIVHISGVAGPELALDRMVDADRALVDAADCIGNVEQLQTLIDAGYDGPVSYECFAPGVHALADPFDAIRRSFDFITAQMRATAA